MCYSVTARVGREGKATSFLGFTPPRRGRKSPGDKVEVEILSHGTSLRQPHDVTCDCRVRQKKCHSILKQVLKRSDNHKLCCRPVVSLYHATKIELCK